jgi:hypothetical protein
VLRGLPHLTLHPPSSPDNDPDPDVALTILEQEVRRRADLVTSTRGLESTPELLIVFEQCDWISGYDKAFTIMVNTLLREGAGLGIHVLISTSNLLNTQDIPRDAFNYCICHKTENALSSRVAIGTDEAA